MVQHGAWIGRQAKRGIDDHRARRRSFAAPVEIHFLSKSQVPCRWEISLPNRTINGHGGHEVLGEVHGVIAAGAPIWNSRTIHPRQLLLTAEDGLLSHGNDQEAITQLVDPIQMRMLLDLRQKRVWIEVVVFGAIGQEPEKSLNVGSMVWTSADKLGRFVRLGAKRSGVTHRAVIGNA